MDIIFPSIAAVVSLSLVGIIFGIILSAAKIKLHVEKDERIALVEDALPGANCGACGLPGCAAYATKIVEYDLDITLCPVGGSETVDNVAKIMGIEADGSGVPMIARLHCQGGLAETINKFEYNGPKSCTASNKLMDGHKVCSYGCLGFGDCERVCPFDAIHVMDNGLPVVDWDACTGCNKCVEVCPREILTLAPVTHEVNVMCMNKEKAPTMKKGCTVGCIGCKLCEKACKKVHEENPAVESSIVVESFCATIDYDTCTNCMDCVVVCPVPVINPIEKSKKYQKLQQAKLDPPKEIPKEIPKEEASVETVT